MVPAWMPTHPPIHLPGLQQQCKPSLRAENNAGAAEEGREGEGKEGRGGGEPRAEERTEQRGAGSRAPTPAAAGARGEEPGGGRRGSGQREARRAGGSAAASVLLSLDALLLHAPGSWVPAPGVCECERACMSDRGRGCGRCRRRRHPGCFRGPAAPRGRLELTGARGGRWLARAPPSSPIPGACPNFLIQGTCRRSSCALSTVITVPSRQPPAEHAAAAAVSADATIVAIATASRLTGRAPGGYLQFPGATIISLPPSPAPLREAGSKLDIEDYHTQRG
ncbi:uncharacterized protein [Chlorocebus sabaeus]|uniref:uncharacterized protein n=1 Tax=Chlorocebus sabaeus TaxID=60711 RepID=UPI003BFA1BCF